MPRLNASLNEFWYCQYGKLNNAGFKLVKVMTAKRIEYRSGTVEQLPEHETSILEEKLDN